MTVKSLSAALGLLVYFSTNAHANAFAPTRFELKSGASTVLTVKDLLDASAAEDGKSMQLRISRKGERKLEGYLKGHPKAQLDVVIDDKTLSKVSGNTLVGSRTFVVKSDFSEGEAQTIARALKRRIKSQR